MRRRALSTSILLFVLLAGAWGNVLAAALCPRMAEDHSCCPAKASPHAVAHDAIGDMQMSEMQMTGEMEMSSAMTQGEESNVIAQPDESCEHCISHSQLPAGTSTLREGSQSRRVNDVAAPLVTTDSNSLPSSFILPIQSRQHAPPGTATSRHVLISVFRI